MVCYLVNVQIGLRTLFRHEGPRSAQDVARASLVAHVLPSPLSWLIFVLATFVAQATFLPIGTPALSRADGLCCTFAIISCCHKQMVEAIRHDASFADLFNYANERSLVDLVHDIHFSNAVRSFDESDDSRAVCLSRFAY